MGCFQSIGSNQKLQKADFGFTLACKINWRSFTLHVFETISCTSELLKCTIVTLLLLRILKRVVATDFFNAINLPYIISYNFQFKFLKIAIKYIPQYQYHFMAPLILAKSAIWSRIFATDCICAHITLFCSAVFWNCDFFLTSNWANEIQTTFLVSMYLNIRILHYGSLHPCTSTI